MKNTKIKKLVEGAVMLALATVLSFIRVFNLPWGGSITLLSMLPIILFSLKYGMKDGLCIAFCYSLIQFFQGIGDGLFGWGLTLKMLIACILFDYIIAFTVLGLVGIFKNKGSKAWIGGIALVVFLRFICHFISGVFVWKSFGELWSGFSTDNVWLYSLLYNGAYMLPELIFTALGAIMLINVPQIKKLLTEKN